MPETLLPVDVTPDDFEVVGGAPGVPAEVFERLFGAQFGYAFLADADGVVRALSASASALYEGAEGVGSPLVEAAWWEDPSRMAEAMRRVRRGMYDRFYAAVLRDGARRSLLVDVQPVAGPSGEDWLSVEARDVTVLLASEHQMHDAHAQLEREHARLAALLQASPDLICAVDAQGRVTDTNAAWREAVGDALGRVPEEGEVYVETSPHAALWRRALGGETVSARVRLPSAGRLGWLDVSFAPVRSDDGRVLGALLVGRNVTDRVEAAHLRVALDQAGAGTFTFAANGRLLASAPAFRALFKLPEGGASLDDVLARARDADGSGAAIRKSLGTPGAVVDVELDVDGTAVRLRGRSVRLDEGVRLFGVAYADLASDATARERWEDLVSNAGWGGRTAGARVDAGHAAAPTDADALAARLDALRQTGLLDSAPTEAFDALTRLVSAALGVPVSLVSLVDADRQFFKSQVGLDAETAEARQTPLSHSFCQHVANGRRPLVVRDARTEPLVAENLAVRDLDVVAYLGVPVAAPDGHVIGALCAIDGQPRDWTDDDLRLLSSVAEAVTAEVAAHQATHSSP